MGSGRARVVAWLAGVVIVASLVVLPWWPTDFTDPYFLSYRSDPVERYERYADNWWDWVPYAYFKFVYLIHVLAAVLAPSLMTVRGWRFVGVGLIAVTTVWQLIAVVPFGLINTTVVPYLAMVAGVVLVIAALVGGRPDDTWEMQPPRPTPR